MQNSTVSGIFITTYEIEIDSKCETLAFVLEDVYNVCNEIEQQVW